MSSGIFAPEVWREDIYNSDTGDGRVDALRDGC